MRTTGQTNHSRPDGEIENHSQSGARLVFFDLACAWLVFGLSVLALWSWGAGINFLLVSDNVPIPPAPSAALCLFLLSAALLLRRSSWTAPTCARIQNTLAAIVVAVGGLVCLRAWMGWASPLEAWFAQGGDHVGGSRIGIMSPLTGGLCMAAGLAHGLAARTSNRFSWGGRSARILGLLVGLGSGLTFLVYVLIGPSFYGAAITPISPWTSLTFLFVGGALTAEAARLDAREIQIQPPPRDSSLSVRHLRLFLTVLGILALGAFTALYLRHARQQDQDESFRWLETIADSKLAQLVEWRQERLRDATFFATAEFFSHDTLRFLNEPTSAEARRRLVRTLELVIADNKYASVALYDTNANQRLAVGQQAGTPRPRAISPALFAEVLLSQRATMSDLFRSVDDDRIYLDVAFPILAPVIDRQEPAEPMKPHAIGVGLFRLDPHGFLFPLLQRWPTASASAETILFRSDGKEALFLNELRHATNTALRLRLPSVRGLLRERGRMEGRDYRGTVVLADINPVPDSKWFLLCKIDRKEVYGPLRVHAWLTLAVTLAFALAAGLLVGFVVKRGEAESALKDLVNERRHLSMTQRVRHLMKNAADAILISDAQDQILDANDRAEELYGRSLAELRTLKLPDLRSPEARLLYARQAARLAADGHAIFETQHQHKDGSVFPVEISIRVIEIDGVAYKLAFIRDITQRKAHEHEILRLQRFYATLSQVNRTIVRLRRRNELFSEVSRIAVESGGFKAAWIGTLDSTNANIELIATAGEGCQSLVSANPKDEDASIAFGPIRACLREGKTCVWNDPMNDERTISWRGEAGVRQWLAVAAVPIRVEREVCAALTVCANEPGVFQDREIALLEEMALDLSFALERFQQEEARLRAEEALHGSEAQLRTLVDNIPQKIFIKDRSSRYEFINLNYAQDLGIRPEEATGKSDYDFFPKDLAEQYRADDKRVMDTGQIETLEEKYLQNGKDIWIQTLKAPLRDQQGHVVGLCGIFHDITERKRVEQALWQRLDIQAQLEQVAATVPGMIYSFRMSAEGAFSMPYASAAIFETYGLRPEQVRDDASAAFALINGEDLDGVKKSIQESARNMTPWRMDFRIQHCTKGMIWVEGHSVPEAEPGGSILWRGFLQDITERRGLEARLRQSQKMEAIGQLAGGVAHDFNNILASMMIQADLSLMAGHLPADAREGLIQIRADADRAANLTRQLLLFSRKQVMQQRDLDLNDVVTSLAKMLQRIIGEDIRLQLNLHPRPLITHADAAMLDQVLMNLVVNARDAMPNGGKLIIETSLNVLTDSDTANIPETKPGSYVGFLVSDTGCGIPTENLSRIFEPFFTTKEPGRGTGLGLATVFGIVQQHGGAIQVESEVGRGTQFRILLPAAESPDASSVEKVTPLFALAGTETVLLVEDEPVLRRVTRTLLEKAGYKVCEAADGAEALRKWDEHGQKIQILLTDIVMPEGISGRDLAARLREKNPKLPVVFTSGYSSEIAGRDLNLQEGENFIQKPASPERLLAVIRRALNG